MVSDWACKALQHIRNLGKPVENVFGGLCKGRVGGVVRGGVVRGGVVRGGVVRGGVVRGGVVRSRVAEWQSGRVAEWRSGTWRRTFIWKYIFLVRYASTTRRNGGHSCTFCTQALQLFVLVWDSLQTLHVSHQLLDQDVVLLVMSWIMLL